MRLTKKGQDFIKWRESCKLTAYQDIAGVWTIGYGTILIDNKPVTPGMTITWEQADQYFLEECQEKENGVLSLLQTTTVTDNQLDALVSLCYNIGVMGFATSTLLRELRAARPIVLDYFARWNKVKDPKTGQLVISQGLLNRRVMEFDIFSKGLYV